MIKVLLTFVVISAVWFVLIFTLLISAGLMKAASDGALYWMRELGISNGTNFMMLVFIPATILTVLSLTLGRR